VIKGFKKGYKQGLYEPIYPQKWVLTESFDMNEKGIKYRSSYEYKFCVFCDMNPDIVKVNSEGIVVPYYNPAKERVARYFLDFIIQNKSGRTFLVEIKPLSETLPPKKPKNNSQKSIFNYQKSLETFAVNQAKWQAAREYATSQNWEFVIITEKELGI